MPLSLTASGNIAPARFVTQSTTTNRTVAQAGAGDQVIGVCGVFTHLTPLSGLDDGYHAIAGETVTVFDTPGEEVWLELGGTVAAKDFIKSDANGAGVTASSTNFYGARALTSGVSGQQIKVQLAFGTL